MNDFRATYDPDTNTIDLIDSKGEPIEIAVLYESDFQEEFGRLLAERWNAVLDVKAALRSGSENE